MRVRVKICGITTIEDSLCAAATGADALGLNFYPPSARAIDPAGASAIAALAPPFVSKVGVFVDPEADWVREVLGRVKLDVLQFQGDETPEFCESFGLPYVKAIAARAGVDFEAAAETHCRATALLLDTYHPTEKGGTGTTFDWSLWPPRLRLPLILAGGLTPENVAAAIDVTQPYAVDVCGGVESPQKGIKDPSKIQRFIEEVDRASRK